MIDEIIKDKNNIKNERKPLRENPRNATMHPSVRMLLGSNSYLAKVYRPYKYQRKDCICGINGQDPDCNPCKILGFDSIGAHFAANSHSIGGGDGSNSVVRYGVGA